jgi:hypothetical protein
MYHDINDGSPESHDDVIRRTVARLRAPLPIDSALDARIMAAVRAEGRHIVRTGAVGGRRAVWRWMVSLACVSQPHKLHQYERDESRRECISRYHRRRRYDCGETCSSDTSKGEIRVRDA